MISIIIPVYNTEKYIKRCIESVVSQDEFENQELILIDDGSTDSSGEICSIFSKQYNNMSYFRTKNHGVSHARNYGISKASHKYIMFVDSDDYLAEGVIKRVSDEVVENGVLIFNKVFFVNGEIISNVLYKEEKFERTGSDIRFFEYDMLTYKLDPKMNEVRWLSCGVTAKIFDASIIKNLNFVENCNYGEDSLFNIRAFHNSEKVKYINFDGYNFNINDESSTGKYRNDWVELQTVFIHELTNLKKELLPSDVEFEKAYQFMVFTRFSSMINKFYFNKNNPDSFSSNYAQFIEMVNKEPYKNSIDMVDPNFLNRGNKVLYYFIKAKLLKLFCRLYWWAKRHGY
jgi:glycosyltransferase involved in cell wall biosynthesis